MEYVQIRYGLSKYDLVPASDDIYKYVKDHTKEHFRSIFRYNEEHYKLFKRNGSIAGIRDVTTNSLLFDFDSKDNVEQARLDALTLCQRLLNYKIPEDDIKICFSGRKGFSVEVVFDRIMSVDMFKSLTRTLAGDLKTFDPVVSDANRIIRLEFTKHSGSGLYKTPFTIEELKNKSIDEIKQMSSFFDQELFKDIKQRRYSTKFPETLAIAASPETKKTQTIKATRLDFTQKPRGFSNCKFALLNGHFDESSRTHGVIRLAATCRANGFPEHSTLAMCNSAAEKAALLTGTEQLDENKVKETVKQVYSPTWRGGQYTCKTDNYLKLVCDRLGENKCQHGEETTDKFASASTVFREFESFAKHIDENTIKTGLTIIDDKIKITTSMLVGILGSPGSGKTSWAIDILKHSSENDVPSVFLSLDMGQPIIIQKLLMKETGQQSDDIFDIFKDDNVEQIDDYEKLLSEKYKNVAFDFKSGQTIAEIREKILIHQEKLGRKVKLLVVDYLECLASNSQSPDSTANTALIANQLKDLSNELNICTILILQPQKTAGDVSEPIRSMRQVKGASTLEQALSVLFGIYREGFSPNRPEDDKFITINVLKNRMGQLLSKDFYWDGLRGEIKQLDTQGFYDLDKIRDRKIKEKQERANADRW